MAALWLSQAQPGSLDSIGAASNSLADYLKLILVLGAILLLAFLVLRVWLPRLTVTSGSAVVQILARAPLEPRKTLYIVKAGSDYVLLGSSDQGIHLLSQLQSGGVEEALLANPDRPPAVDFGALVRRWRGEPPAPEGRS